MEDNPISELLSLTGGNKGQFEIQSRAQLARPDFAYHLRQFFDEYLHFGSLKGDWVNAGAGSETHGEVYNMDDLGWAEMGAGISNAHLDGESKIWWGRRTSDERFVFERDFEARIPVKCDKSFAPKNYAPINAIGMRVVPPSVGRSDMVQVIEDRLQVLFPNAYSVLPTRGKGGAVIPLEEISPDEEYKHFRISVGVDAKNVSDVFRTIADVQKLGVSGFAEQQQNLPAPDGR